MSVRALSRKADAAGEGAHVSEMQRRRLLLAIVEVASKRGLEAATVGRICEQASISRRTFYELFEDRDDCLLAAFDSEVRSFAERMRGPFEREARWTERVRGALTVLLERLDAEPHVARFCVIEAPRGGGKTARHHHQVLETLALVLSREAAPTTDRAGPLPLTAQGVLGGALSVIRGRLLERTAEEPFGLVELVGPLMAMTVHPYLGAAAARRELERPAPCAPHNTRTAADPFKGLPIRFTYRTARVLDTIAESPGASNRHIASSSGISDDGQVSRLLARLSRCELIENRGLGHTKGEPNAWRLTERGAAIHSAIAQKAVAL